VILTLVSVGYNCASFDDKPDTCNLDLLYYANLALQRIEAGQKTKTGNWGVFEPFKKKDEALCWLNYIIGWINFDLLNQKKTGIIYLYKSTQIGSEKKNDIGIYGKIGYYYSETMLRIPEDYLDWTTDEKNALLAFDKAKADRIIDAYGRAYKLAQIRYESEQKAKEQKGRKVLIDFLYKILADLYKFRFNLQSVNADDVDKYVEKLIRQPMPDPAIPIKPLAEEPVEYIRNKSR
jgi:hypothetical protein